MMTPASAAPVKLQPNDLVLAIISEAGKVPGRTSLQKLCYFVNEELDAGVPFKAHYYGPYSEEIANAADVQVGAHLVHEEVERGQYFKAGKTREWARHSYSLTADGERYLDWLVRHSPVPKNEIRAVVSKLQAETSLDPDSLAKLAKVRFIADRLHGTSPHPVLVTRCAKQYGWRLAPSVVRQSLITLNRLQL